MADDAVLIGPVSGLKFPANREINREFRGFGPNSTIRASIQPATSMACSQIPYATEQGIFLPKQGIPSSEQGIFWAEQASQISASLSAHCGALAWPRSGLKRGDERKAGRPNCRWMRFLARHRDRRLATGRAPVAELLGDEARQRRGGSFSLADPVGSPGTPIFETQRVWRIEAFEAVPLQGAWRPTAWLTMQSAAN